MKYFITGGSGLLGRTLRLFLPDRETYAPSRRIRSMGMDYGDFSLEDTELPKDQLQGCRTAWLCAGTKGTEACEGNREAFRSDVDGNIRLAKFLLSQGTFVVFVSTDAVEWALHTAYARNRFMVELAIGGLPNVAIFRPGRFDETKVSKVAKHCARVGLERIAGLTRWP